MTKPGLASSRGPNQQHPVPCLPPVRAYGPTMPVCIAGMHGSGTSMVASRLHACGLYLGPADALMPATSDNPLGYWEDLRFVALNDAILRASGGAWDAPPPIDPAAGRGWKLALLRARARALLRSRSAYSRWGWKDPRNCLTLAFWMELIPDLKVVICVRHPAEVAQSVRTRTFSSNSDGLRLWQLYNSRLMAATTPAQRIVTHYDAHFRDPQRELQRLLDFAGIAEPQRQPELVRRQLRHHDHAGAPLSETDTDPAVRNLYARLCAEAA